MTVAGDEVSVIHVQISSVLGNDPTPTRGTYDNHLWVTPDGVIAQRSLEASVTAGTPVGDISYEESFDLEALSLDAAAG